MSIQILILFLLISVCGCQVSQQAQTNEISNNSNLNQETIVNSVENNSPKTEEPKPVDNSNFSTVRIEKTERRTGFSLGIDIEYPQFKKAKTSQEVKFNQYVKKQVDEQIADFINFLVNEKMKEVKRKTGHEFEISLQHKFEYVSENFISVLMNWRGYSGYLNEDFFPSTINFDLKKGKVVGLKELFEPNSQYLNKISEESRKILKRTCLSCSCGNGISAGDTLPEELIKEAERKNQNATNVNSKIYYQDSLFFEKGTEPTEENYSGWSITAEGLKITFGEYQVGPGCIGIIDIVIPFNDLQPILRKDLNFN
jgi:hypothetical protein